jgi:hypothetical protein
MMGAGPPIGSTGDATMAETRAVPDRLAATAALWASAAANFVPSLPVRPAVAASYEAHVIATICVELLQPLTGVAARWAEGGSTSALGRVEVKLRHLEATQVKVGRDLGLSAATIQTRAVLDDLKVRPTAPRREGTAGSTWFEVAVDEEEVLVAREALLTLSTALREGAAGSSRRAGSADYRFRDAPAVLAFWSMKVETCSPGITQRLPLRLARRSPKKAIADATRELSARLRAEPTDIAASERYTALIALCERSLADLADLADLA